MELRRQPTELLQAASRVQREANLARIGSPDSLVTDPRNWLDRYDENVTFDSLRTASRNLFANGHYARAVEEAFKCLNNTVKDRSGLQSLDGDSLMRRAFSADSPTLKLNGLRSRSEKDEQRGYMDMYAGAMSGIRNPRAHEHELQDPPAVALELLAIANHLMRKLYSARRARIRKKQA